MRIPDKFREIIEDNEYFCGFYSNYRNRPSFQPTEGIVIAYPWALRRIMLDIFLENANKQMTREERTELNDFMHDLAIAGIDTMGQDYIAY